MSVSFKPAGYHSITPYLLAEDADQLLEFIKLAFNGVAIENIRDPSGQTQHGAIKVGDSIIMVGKMRDHASMSTILYLYVEDADATYHQALKAGAVSIMEPADQFYGDRNAAVRDCCGNEWWIATMQEDLSPEEITKRAHEKYSQS